VVLITSSDMSSLVQPRANVRKLIHTCDTDVRSRWLRGLSVAIPVVLNTPKFCLEQTITGTSLVILFGPLCSSTQALSE
jgi:hypothetical protein